MQKDNNGLVFIVDISGYSQFVRDINPVEGIQIIRALLQAIIENNQLAFRISEIEGDAVLFYRPGTAPSIEEVLQQFARMRNAFKNVLRQYSPGNPHEDKLDLKAVAHYGYMEEYQVDRFIKLYGNTLVDAHRLLKNSVPAQAYVLLTTDYLKQMADFPLNYSTDCGNYQCDLYDVGSLCYTYFAFGEDSEVTTFAANRAGVR